MDLGDGLGTLRFLIHDRDLVFTVAFGEVFKADGRRIVKTLPKAPRVNAICERVIGTLRRELLDQSLILGERHLVLGEYLVHYNAARPHRSRGLRPRRTSKRCRPGTRPTSPTCGPSGEDPPSRA